MIKSSWTVTSGMKMLEINLYFKTLVQVKPHFGRFSQSNVFKNKSRGAGIMLVLRLPPLIHSKWMDGSTCCESMLWGVCMFNLSPSRFLVAPVSSCCGHAARQSRSNNQKSAEQQEIHALDVIWAFVFTSMDRSSSGLGEISPLGCCAVSFR